MRARYNLRSAKLCFGSGELLSFSYYTLFNSVLITLCKREQNFSMESGCRLQL